MPESGFALTYESSRKIIEFDIRISAIIQPFI